MKNWDIVFIGCLLGTILISVAYPQKADSADTPPPWELMGRQPGDSFWGPLLRLQAAEEDYRHGQWWDYYLQFRAQSEADAGNHAVALSIWDQRRPTFESDFVLPAGIGAVDAIDYLATVADTAQVLMINERHHAASDRLLTHRLLGVLREKGFQYFAAETFDYGDSTLNERKFPIEDTGGYISEPVFAGVVREALRLGYTLVPYEASFGQGEDETESTPQQRRDRAQAKNLYDNIFRDNPDAKVLVHAGFNHILEEATESWYPMALYFREISGINPVTIDQENLSERSTIGHEHPVYRAVVAAEFWTGQPLVLTESSGQLYPAIDIAVDIQVVTPRTTYTDGRPNWMSLNGHRVPVVFEFPECRNQRCFVEAKVLSEPAEAIALDRCESDSSGTVTLFLPPGETVRVTVLSADQSELKVIEYVVDDN